MKIEDLKTQTVAILGFGQEGQAVTEYLLKNGITPKIFDGKQLAEWKPANLAKLLTLGLPVICDPEFIDKAFAEASVVFRSPGIKLSTHQIQTAQSKKILITSQTQWFFRHCPAKIIGVTGTKGKGTTSSLIYEILQAGLKDSKIFLTGNIGKDQPLEFIDELTDKDYVVYELSSFQLQDLNQSPQIGVCLMVTSDHLDYHSDLDEYHSAKSAISAFQTSNDLIIYNADYPATVKIGELGQGKKWQISKTTTPAQGAQILETEEQIKIIGIGPEELTISTSQRLLRGKHNLENIAAACLVATYLNISPQTIEQSVASFAGLKHRLQFVTEKSGVKYYNDSISTIPETTIAAIRSFSEPLILILGGAEKNLNYDDLISEIEKNSHVKTVVCMGPAGQHIHDQLVKSSYQGSVLGPFFDFEEVFKSAQQAATQGDAVLLSPAATSFDLFKSYADRGEKFITLTKEGTNG